MVANPRLNLEDEVSRLEAELRIYKELKLSSIERRLNELLDALDDPATPQTKGQRLRERLGIIATTVALVAIAQSKFDIPLVFQQPPKQEQVAPKLSPPLVPSLIKPQLRTAPPVDKPVAKPVNLQPSTFNLQPSFADKVRQVAKQIGADPVDLLTLMSFETAGTLSPTQRGPHVPGQGRAIGLIQFMPGTAKELGTSTQKLSTMSAVEQLDYVECYLIKRGFKPGMGLKQLYSTVFAGNPHAPGSISDGYHTLDSAVARMNREHRPRAIAILEGKDNSFSRKSKFADTKAIISTWLPEFQKDPVTGDTIAGYTVSSARGMRISPTTGKYKMHQGIDLATPIGTPLIAIADGQIECDWWLDAGRVALFTSEEFPGLRFDLLHLSKCTGKQGSKLQVKKGEVIGFSGTAGTGPHLHLAIKSQESGKFLRVRSGWLHWFVTGKEPK